MSPTSQPSDRPACPVPRVSVCIPTYRGAATIDAAISSVLAQTEPDLELVIVDDNSPDDTEAVVARHAEDPRLRYVRNSRNLGPQGNWNRCLDEARGRHFKLLPHDDVLAPQCLERQAAVLDADTDERLALVFCAREILGPNGRVLMRRGLPKGREGRIAAATLIRSCVRRGTNLIGEPGAVLMRRSLVKNVGPFDATHPYVIDLNYWFRLLEWGDAYYCNEALACFRISRSQWSVALNREQSRDFLSLIGQKNSNNLHDLSSSDRLVGRAAAQLNQLARQFFYTVILARYKR